MSAPDTVRPPAYPALEAEVYRATESEHDRQTEPPPAPPTVIWATPPRPVRRAKTKLVPLPWGWIE